eukprot:363590-Chlamydomonas_euryale.AAC.6
MEMTKPGCLSGQRCKHCGASLHSECEVSGLQWVGSRQSSRMWVWRHSECGVRCIRNEGFAAFRMWVLRHSGESESELQGADPIGYACVRRNKQSKITCKGSA